MDLEIKMKKLEDYLRGLGSVAVAFSGGTDSAFLLKIAHNVLGEDVIAVTVNSCQFPESEFKEAEDFCRQEKIKQISFSTDEFSIKGFSKNPPDRCYLCKKNFLTRILDIAKEEGIPYVAEGSNMDDNNDYRPGLMAVSELGVKSPLREALLYKDEIRLLSKKTGLKTWDKPSFACLYTRFSYGEDLSREKTSMVEKAEKLLAGYGFRQVRVRVHGNLARIEVLPEDIEKLADTRLRLAITEKFRQYGFDYVALDMEGYRTGSMNGTLNITTHG